MLPFTSNLSLRALIGLGQTRAQVVLTGPPPQTYNRRADGLDSR